MRLYNLSMHNFDINNSQKIVIKIGSSLLTNSKGGLNRRLLKNLVADINWLLKKRKNVIIVSSGAISLGKGKLNIKNELTLNQSQAVAARGQIELMTAWKNEFKKHKKQVAQILLSPTDIKNKKSSQNAIVTIENLLSYKCVPIINENDTTSTDEIRFGDNDILAAQIATLIEADCLILLSNVDGLYKQPPKNNTNDDLVLEVRSITKKIKEMAGAASKLGKGGMISKIKAAEICMKSKCPVIITSGLKDNPIKSLNNKKTKSTKFIV
jgi:glutamate 5-kinase